MNTSTISYVPGNTAKQGDSGEGVEWLEDKTLAGFRVWQLAGIIISALITITVGLCCCIKFRIPRTKQEIEADWIRKKITRSFRHELSKISDKEMDEMNLKRALEKVRAGFDNEREEAKQEYRKVLFKKPERELRTRFNKMFHDMHARFIPVPPEAHIMI
ncbi:transmembrane inner ear expressed protein [Belonocnema kinseyi]|uniref:transmembrane inner ear expressed protein n=1 Tax=Belonocnema kinseyi TaxID=2817044 RepID=UPI00143D98A8|nr:transmembrane inner ear expressed protein [Belonocnema kinseyi]